MQSNGPGSASAAPWHASSPEAHDAPWAQSPAPCRDILMESPAAAAATAPSRPPPALLLMPHQPSSASAAAAAASQYFLTRASAAAAAGILRTDRENLAELEHKLMEARQRFQVLKEEKCNASSTGCGCGCCPHGFVHARDQKATSVGPDSRSVSETSNLPLKKSGGRQHLTRSNLGASRCSARQRRSLRINGIPPSDGPAFRSVFDV